VIDTRDSQTLVANCGWQPVFRAFTDLALSRARVPLALSLDGFYSRLVPISSCKGLDGAPTLRAVLSGLAAKDKHGLAP
jgi:hypothetical protein